MEDFIEAILVWNEKGPSKSVIRWLKEHHLTVVAMSTGLLISGMQGVFEKAFGVDLQNADPPLQLPIPAKWPKHVASLGIPRPRVPHGVGQ